MVELDYSSFYSPLMSASACMYYIPSLFKYSNHIVLQGHEYIIKSLPLGLIEGILHFCNQVAVDVFWSRLVLLQALNRIEEAKIKYTLRSGLFGGWGCPLMSHPSIAAMSCRTVHVASG